jgi:endonuclease/exonuclease/phosphatase family metal-dependent hydrolase
VPAEDALIVAGDFNDWSTKVHTDFAAPLGLNEVFMERTGKHARTYPAACPLFCMDRIYIRGVEIIDARVFAAGFRSRISDHAGLSAELQLT